jgi:predicted transcriptional regulator
MGSAESNSYWPAAMSLLSAINQRGARLPWVATASLAALPQRFLTTLTSPSVSLYPRGMEVDFTPEQLQRISQIAAHSGTDPEHLVKNAALRLVEEDAKFRAPAREGLAQVDRGELVDDEEVRLWLEGRECS